MFKDDPLAEYFAEGGQVGFRLQNPVTPTAPPDVITEIPQDTGSSNAPVVPPVSDIGQPDWWDPTWGSYADNPWMNGNWYYDYQNYDPNQRGNMFGSNGYNVNTNYMGVPTTNYAVPTQTNQPASTAGLYDPKKIALKQR